MDFKKYSLGIELGSTRIKATLIDESFRVIASGSHEWENKLKNGIWTYSDEDIKHGIVACYADIKRDVREKYGVTLCEVGAIGISGMMHGYLALDRNLELISDFRTWRNTITAEEARELTDLFSFNVPDRWSIAHLYKSVKDGDESLRNIDYLTTLSGYIHTRLTGERVLGIGDASGMFPIDRSTKTYDAAMVKAFDKLADEHGFKRGVLSILPTVLTAGEAAGVLTDEGAEFLDPEGDLKAGIPLAPPEGDAGTGMIATNAIKPGTGNVSCGTSDFAMIVTDKELGLHREIDIVSTPDGETVAMIHCNNCTSDINAWCELFGEFATLIGSDISKGQLYTTLFREALKGEADGGGLMSCNYLSGEAITGFDEGRPLFVRTPESKLTLASFMRVHLMSALATLKIGMRTLESEGVEFDTLIGHGGYFKTEGVGSSILSAALGCKVVTMESAGEGGPYGMAILASYLLAKNTYPSLPAYLDGAVFKNAGQKVSVATESERAAFDKFTASYERMLKIEKAAVDALK